MTSDAFSAMIPWNARNPWCDGCDLRAELAQARSEGRDLSSVEPEFAHLIATPGADGAEWFQLVGGQRDYAWYQRANALLDRVQELPIRANFPFVEPSDLVGIRSARPPRPAPAPWSDDHAALVGRIHGGLLGRIIGCQLGKPVEGWSRKNIQTIAAATDNYPLRHYIRQPTSAECEKIRKAMPWWIPPREDDPAPWKRPMFLDQIEREGMLVDDDINYTVVGLGIVSMYGGGFTPMDVAQYWTTHLPLAETCSAERMAYRAFANCIMPPWSATWRNPYREWIGAQIRADYFGYANPGDPQRAAEFAWRDGCVSHVKNGIYGEMWVAAMLAACFVENDWKRIIAVGLGEIPQRCRLRQGIERVLAAHARGDTFDQLMDQLLAQTDIPDLGIHTISNAQVVAAALLYGEDDFTTTIGLSVMAGWDTDCNGATVGSLFGIKHGSGGIPRSWTAPLKNRCRTAVPGWLDQPIDALAARMADIVIASA